MKVVLSEAPGARLVMGPPVIVTPTTVSARVIFARGTSPVLVTVKVYVMVSPAFATPLGGTTSRLGVPTF